LEPLGLEDDDDQDHFGTDDDDASYGDPVASSTGIICLNCYTLR